MADNEIEEQIKWFQNNLKKDDLDPSDRYFYTRDLKHCQLLLKEKDFLKLLLLATKIKKKDENVKNTYTILESAKEKPGRVCF